MKMGAVGFCVVGLSLLTVGSMWSDNPQFVWDHMHKGGQAGAGIVGSGVDAVRGLGNQIAPVLGAPIPTDGTVTPKQ
jgi:hypothetical protein